MLYLYQPIQYVDAADWTGYQLTVQALFSNPSHPVAQSTYADMPLLWPDRAMPPYWDGLYEVRMYFSQPSNSPETTTYPAAVIRVTGQRWTLLSAVTASCSAGTAVAYETVVLPKSETEIPHVLSANGKNLVPADAGSGVSTDTSGTTVPGSQKGVNATHQTTAPAQSAPSSSSTTVRPKALASGTAANTGSGGSSAWIIGGAVAGVIVVGSAGVWFWRTRRRLPAGPASGDFTG
jgi:hypothetical protein